MKFMPPEKPPELLSWIGGEFAGWVVGGLSIGAISCAFTERYAVASVLGMVAAIGVFLMLEHHRSKSAIGPGLYYCPKCQYYLKPEHIEGGASAI